MHEPLPQIQYEGDIYVVEGNRIKSELTGSVIVFADIDRGSQLDLLIQKAREFHNSKIIPRLIRELTPQLD